MTEHNTSHSTHQRIQWIDALRGFVMLLVVFQHVHSICFHITTPISLFFVTFRMPLFFFISGFIAHRLKAITNFGDYRSLMLKKTRVQALPTIVFGLLFTVMGLQAVPGDLSSYLAAHPQPDYVDMAQHFFLSAWKHGYWFTWTLLGIFLIYFTVNYLLRRMPRRWVYIVLSVISLALFIYSPINSWPALDCSGWLGFFSFRHVAHYFQFFVAGNIVACYWQPVLRWLKNQYHSAIVILLFLGISIALRFNATMCLPQGDVTHWVVIFLNLLQQYCGIFTMVLLFCTYESAFSQQKVVGRTLQFVGRRTLDIYLIHYFFLPEMSVAGQYLESNMLLTTLAAVGLAVVIVALSLAVSSLLRCSPFLAHYLFGAKR